MTKIAEQLHNVKMEPVFRVSVLQEAEAPPNTESGPDAAICLVGRVRSIRSGSVRFRLGRTRPAVFTALMRCLELV